MAGMHRPTWAVVHTPALEANVRAVRQRIGASCQLMAVVKANGYGHGAVRTALAATAAGAAWLGVATLDEALELRHAGLAAPLLVLGYVSAEFAQVAASQDITVTAVSTLHARQLASTALTRPLHVHLKIDTGMGRIGVCSSDELAASIDALTASSCVQMTGAYTHFAKADEADKSHTYRQLSLAKEFFAVVKARVGQHVLVHAANSAAILDLPESWLDMVRLGISLYGVYPSSDVRRDGVVLQSALELFTQVVHVKRVPAGTTVSYGGTFVADRETVVATLPIGYADGLPRALSNHGFVKIHGQRCPIIGRICMDQTMVDVTDLPNVQVGDIATVFDGEMLEEAAMLAGTIPYELLTGISQRVPRVYE